VLALLLVGFDAATWVRLRVVPDDAMVKTVNWMYDNVPAQTRVATLAQTAEQLLPSYQIVLQGAPSTPSDLLLAKPAYVLTSSVQVSQGYGWATPADIDWLRQHGEVRASFAGRTFGTITIWQLPYATASGVPPGRNHQPTGIPDGPSGTN
jgi:hypothetical protein